MPALGKDLSPADLKQLQSKMKSSDSLTVDFVQTSYTATRDRSRKRQGQAVFRKPDKFKWMLETPVKEYKIYDGKNFYDYSPDSKSAVRYAPSGAHAQELKQIVDLVLNVDSLLERYELTKASDDGGIILIELTPKSASDITSVALHMSAKDGFISHLKLFMRNKNTLTHEFKNPRPQDVPPSAFALPADVKVTTSN